MTAAAQNRSPHPCELFRGFGQSLELVGILDPFETWYGDGPSDLYWATDSRVEFWDEAA